MDQDKETTLRTLSTLLATWNATGKEIAALIGRPCETGHIAEFIAAAIFDIRLAATATHKGADGWFTHGKLAGASVNIKWSGKHEKLLNLAKPGPPDYYLVFTGEEAPAVSSRGRTRPFEIEHVFLFHGPSIHDTLRRRGIKLGDAASVTSALWQQAEIFPNQASDLLVLDDAQRRLIASFGKRAGP